MDDDGANHHGKLTMQRYRQFGPLDDTLEVFGDVTFERLDMLADPATLPAGAVQACENLRFDANGVSVRGGSARQFPPGTNIGEILFSGIYKPVGGADQKALVTAENLYIFDIPTQTLARYPFPTGQQIAPADPVDVIQAGIGAGGTLPVLYILHGLGNPVMQFDGTRVTVNNAIPPAEFGLFYQNRLVVNSGRQQLGASNFLDFNTWIFLNQFQIEQGGADYLVGLLAYQGDYVLIGSRKKWFIAYFDPNLGTQGYTGDLSNASFVRLLTNEAGPLGKEAMLESAGFIWFVSDNGIFAFQPNLNNQLVPLGRPLSADIQPIFSRISASYADMACIERYGYRLYFALPISDEPIGITSLTVVNQVTQGVTLPTTLPFLLSKGGVATVVVATPHNLNAGDVVQFSGIAGGGINGQWPVLSVTDAVTFKVALPAAVTVNLGALAKMQKIATRNNTILVFNLNNRDAEHPVGMWESVDYLPTGFYADWLRIADYGSQRRLWVVDAFNGPCLYEEGSVDEIGTILGGVRVPFTLPITLTVANYANQPVPGRLLSRAFRWDGTLGSAHGTLAYIRNVRASEARLTLNPGDAGTITTRMRTPKGMAPMTGQVEVTVPFTGTTQPDLAVPKRLFQRALEVELEVNTTAGQPTIRALEVQVRKSGNY